MPPNPWRASGPGRGLRDLGAAALDRVLLQLTGTGNELIRSGPAGTRAVALSFDDGPSPDNTPFLLDLLAEHGAHATFFVVGEMIDGSEELLRRTAGLGHEIGNHTFTHPFTIRIDRGRLLDEVAGTNAAIEQQGARPTLIRPPFGKDRHRFVRVAQRLSMRVALWSLDSGDTRGLAAETIAGSVLAAVSPGDIVLFHDGGERRPETLAACARVVPRLKAEGYELLTISEVLGGQRRTTSRRVE
jgi:peptidoglycan/xylan/chitin deacetylase (PgdA/CDA1 family)